MVDVRLPLERTKDMPLRARAFVTEHLATLPPELSSDIVLMASELVTNVVVHGATPAHLHLVIIGDAVHVLVHDSGGDMPVTPPADLSDLRNTRRGMVIVAALARAWGIIESGAGRGKDVWFDVDMRTPHPRSPTAGAPVAAERA